MNYHLFFVVGLTVCLIVFSIFDDHYTKRAIGLKSYVPFWVVAIIPGKSKLSLKLIKFKMACYVLVWIAWLVILSSPLPFLVALMMTILGLLSCIMLGSLLHNIAQSKK